MSDATQAEWSGTPWYKGRDEFWVDDETGELVSVTTGARLKGPARNWKLSEARAAAKG